MSAATDLDTTVIRPARRPAARRTLTCLAYCGGGTGCYRHWTDLLPDDTELALVCYPGREGRFGEDPAGSWDELAADAARAVRAAATGPYVLFGHSMGGWMAFDVAVRLEQQGGPLPDALVVSSCNAPTRGVTDRDRSPHPGDDDAALIAWMHSSGSLPDYVAEDPDLRAMAIELMRADMRVRDSYHPAPDARTSVPVHVLYGADDPTIDPHVASQWRAAAGHDFRIDELPGGHFYTPDVWQRLPRHFQEPVAVRAA